MVAVFAEGPVCQSSVAPTRRPGRSLRTGANFLMTQAPLQTDFRPQPRGIAVVTSAPISSIIDSGHYAVLQDLVDGYASSFESVFVVSPSGSSAITPGKADRVSWFSGPRWLSPANGLWWAAFANRRELRNVELVRSFGPRAGIVGRVLSKLSDAPHVSSADDLAGNGWLGKPGWQAVIARFVNRLGILSADVLSATLDWELEYLAGTGYTGDLLLGSRGLPTGIYTPVGTTDPDRHPVVLWAGDIVADDSVAMVSEVASSTRKMIPNVEFVVVAAGDEADRLKSVSIERDLPLRVVSHEKVEPLVDLIERTWACVTVPAPRRNIPHGLAMLTLSAGIPLISVGELGESHGFKNHLNYISVGRAGSADVAYGLQLLRRWSSFAYRIGSAGQRLIEERYSTRSVALVEGEQLARIATDLGVDVAMSDGARALEATVERLSLEEDGNVDGAEPDSMPDPSVEPAPEAESDGTRGFDLVAAAIAAANGETKPVNPTGSRSDKTAGADMIAALFDGDGVSTESGGALPDGDDGPIGSDESSVRVVDEDVVGLPVFNMVEFDLNYIPSPE